MPVTESFPICAPSCWCTRFYPPSMWAPQTFCRAVGFWPLRRPFVRLRFSPFTRWHAAETIWPPVSSKPNNVSVSIKSFAINNLPAVSLVPVILHWWVRCAFWKNHICSYKTICFRFNCNPNCISPIMWPPSICQWLQLFRPVLPAWSVGVALTKPGSVNDSECCNCHG